MEWSQINTSDFLFLTYVQFYILHPKLYTFGFYSESKCISDSEERSERPGIPSLTDVCSCQKEELVPCGAPGAWLSPGGSRQILCHTLSVSTLGRDVVDTGPTLKIQQPAITSRTRGSNFYLQRKKICGNSIKSIVKNMYATSRHTVLFTSKSEM